ncbi:hypothetical protein LZS94_10110 [Aliivibrio fischeri]|nr:YiaA/YiaB family inner membrane protein [Aliivibrio fischeri]MCE7577849.1 hypothetical protein [Aliivibrio fischeri]MCE7590237.1 hypothetical protein [Aliivibrio fischeri]
MYMMSCRVALISALVLMAIGLRNAELLLSEKGFFAMAYTLSLFSVVTIQKNIRDVAATTSDEGLSEVKDELVE